ncbi:MAG: glycosyltransferase [Anaerolineae bacterium]|nr:glycosyltransferase [Anaerolineae bacterium]NIN96888.1 glycosyltransferase [Anaerolineae bacterium]NIQ82742.1 glycosyltransferase [Anaerolineae bacterium]
MRTDTESKGLNVVAAIPCHNEEQFIGDIVRSAQEYVSQVVVVDDGSSDRTIDAAVEAGAMVVRHGTNKGPGEAYKSCFEAARSLKADVLITLDGDGQHLPDELPRLLHPLLSEEADLVIGSRFLKDYDIPRYRKVGIDVITWLYNLGSAVKVVDAQSCYRGYNRKALDTLRITESGFGFSVELLIQARNRGLVIQEVPVSCIYHRDSHSMNPVLHGVGVALMVIKHRLKDLVPDRSGDPSEAQ